jgi:hypothetical protein
VPFFVVQDFNDHVLGNEIKAVAIIDDLDAPSSMVELAFQ